MFSLFSGLFGNPPPHSLRLLEFPYLNLNDKSECSEFEFLHQNEKSECSEFVFLDQNEKSECSESPCLNLSDKPECSEFELTFSEYSAFGLSEPEPRLFLHVPEPHFWILRGDPVIRFMNPPNV